MGPGEANVRVSVRLFGAVEVCVDESPVVIGSPSQRRIVAMLALHASRVVAMTAFVDALWPTDPPETAISSLRNQVTRLRSVVGSGLIVAQSPGYAFAIPPDNVDVHRFDRILRAKDASLASIDEALGLWRGDPLGEFEGEAWARPTVSRLTEAHLIAQERRIETLIGDACFGEAAAAAMSLCETAPLRERAHALLITALASTGRRSEASDVFDRHRRRLVDQTGLEPSVALRELVLAVLDGRIDTPISAPPPFSAVDARRNPVSPLPIPPHALPLGGRRAELESLRNINKSATERRAQVVMIAGEAGAGKTRIVSEFATGALIDGSTVVVGRCDEEVVASCGPFSQALRRLADVSPMAKELARRANPILLSLVPSLRGSTPSAITDGQPDRFTLFGAVADFLVTFAQAQPHSLVVVLEDMHDADPDTVALLRFLIRSSMPEPIMIVCTYRDTNLVADDRFSKLLADSRNDESVSRMQLTGLSRDDVADVLDRCGGDNSLADELHARSNGNPFFLSELIAAGPATDDDLPPSVRDVIHRRVGLLGPSTHELLRTAAVLGPEVDLDVLTAITLADELTLLTAMDGATAAGLLVEVGVDRWRFAHSLVRESLGSELSLSARTRVHASITMALGRLRPDNLNARAHHADRSGPSFRQETLALMTDWGSRAARNHAFGEGVVAFRRVVELTDELHPTDLTGRITARISHARALNVVGMPSWRDTAFDAGRLAAQAGRPDLMAAASLVGVSRVGGHDLYSVDEDAVVAARTALEAQPIDAIADRALLLARVAGLLDFAATRDEGIACGREALALARVLGDDRVLVRVLTWTANLLLGPIEILDIDERMRELDGALERVDDLGLAHSAAYMRASAHALFGDLAGIDRCIAVFDRAAEAGSVHAVVGGSIVKSYRSLAVGDVAAAIDHADAARRDGDRVNRHGTREIWQGQMFHIQMATGKRFANKEVGEGEHFSRPSLDGPFQVLSQVVRGEVGPAMDALRTEAAREFASLPRDFLWFGGLSAWAGVASMLRMFGITDPGLASAADQLEDLLLPYRGHFGAAGLGLSTPVDIALANAAFAAMRLDDAIDYARGAVALCERTGITLHGSFSKALLAFVLLKQDSPSADDHALARRMLDEAEGWAAAHGTKNLLGFNVMARELLSP